MKFNSIRSKIQTALGDDCVVQVRLHDTLLSCNGYKCLIPEELYDLDEYFVQNLIEIKSKLNKLTCHLA